MPTDSVFINYLYFTQFEGFFQLPTPPIHLTKLQFSGIESSTMALKFSDVFNLLLCSQNA